MQYNCNSKVTLNSFPDQMLLKAAHLIFNLKFFVPTFAYFSEAKFMNSRAKLEKYYAEG